MIKSYKTGYLLLAVLLALGWMGLSWGAGEAAPLAGFTPTPEPTVTPTPMVITDTPGPTGPTDTPASGSDPSAPTATASGPVGTVTLPFTGHTNPSPFWLLVIFLGGFLIVGVYWAVAPRASSERRDL